LVSLTSKKLIRAIWNSWSWRSCSSLECENAINSV